MSLLLITVYELLFLLHDALKTKQRLITSFKAGSEMTGALCTDLHLCYVCVVRGNFVKNTSSCRGNSFSSLVLGLLGLLLLLV